MNDATGLLMKYIEIGELDLFREEDVEFARKLWKAGISTELYIRPVVCMLLMCWRQRGAML
jgi:hypothetical protein